LTQVSRVTTVDHGECCGRRPARGRHCDLPALLTLAPAPLLVLVPSRARGRVASVLSMLRKLAAHAGTQGLQKR